MSWQDFLFLVGSAVLGIGLWPSIRGAHKPDVKTSLTSVVILASYGLAYMTLDLWLAAIGIAVNTAGWLVLLVQGWRKR